MTFWDISRVAALAAFTALAACASAPDVREEAAAEAATRFAEGAAEFHGANIGADALRSRLETEG